MPATPKMTGERAVYLVDRDLRVVTAGENTLALWGKSRPEIVGRYFFDLFPLSAGGDTHRAMMEALRTFRPVRTQAASVYVGAVEIEIYPVADGLQVSFWPAKERRR